MLAQGRNEPWAKGLCAWTWMVFSRNVAVRVPDLDRERVGRICRHCARPAIGENRLWPRANGKRRRRTLFYAGFSFTAARRRSSVRICLRTARSRFFVPGFLYLRRRTLFRPGFSFAAA